MRYLVILDAGHGLDTPGKRTPLFKDGTFMRENEFNRSVVRKIDYLLESNDNIDVIFTSSEKRDVSLDDRVQRANNIYNAYKDNYENIVLVSVHSNAFGDGMTFNSSNGTSTHYYIANTKDMDFAQVIHTNLINTTNPSSDRGIIGSDFQILREVKMCAVLCENLFMTNLEDAGILLTDEFREKTAKGIVNGILEYFNINKKAADFKIIVDYSVTVKGTYQLHGDVKDFGVKLVNQKNRTIKEPFSTNGTFFWWEDKARTKPYPTSILVQNGNIIQNVANHYYSFKCPQSVFIVYKNSKVEMRKIYFATELDYKNIQIAIGGVGLIDNTNPNFKYDPSSEGFKKGIDLQTGKQVDYTDVLRKNSKTVVGYNLKENKIYLMCRQNIAHKNLLTYDLIKLVKDCGYDISLSIDGGGSSFMNNETEMVVFGDNRVINNIIGFGL